MRIKCIETMRRIFAHPDRSVATPYIHALAPRVIEYLYTEQSRRVTSDAELNLTLESIRTVDTLISIAEPKHSKFFSLAQAKTKLIGSCLNLCSIS